MDGYNHAAHAKHSLKVHLIFVTKYRKPIFNTRPRIDIVKLAMFDTALKHKFQITEMETDQDHIHMLVSYPATICIADIVQLLKQYSTHKNVVFKCSVHEEGILEAQYPVV